VQFRSSLSLVSPGWTVSGIAALRRQAPAERLARRELSSRQNRPAITAVPHIFAHTVRLCPSCKCMRNQSSGTRGAGMGVESAFFSASSAKVASNCAMKTPLKVGEHLRTYCGTMRPG
jgi:hypothetical protein